MTISSAYQVRAVQCDHRSSDEEVYQALKRATAPLTRAWDRLKSARRIMIKFNQDWQAAAHVRGLRRELVSDAVARATLRLLRENTSAELVAADISFFIQYDGAQAGTTTWLDPLFKEFGVKYIDYNHEPGTTGRGAGRRADVQALLHAPGLPGCG
jgi:hypothetical protein